MTKIYIHTAQVVIKSPVGKTVAVNSAIDEKELAIYKKRIRRILRKMGLELEDVYTVVNENPTGEIDPVPVVKKEPPPPAAPKEILPDKPYTPRVGEAKVGQLFKSAN